MCFKCDCLLLAHSMGLRPTQMVLTAEKPEEDMTQVDSVTGMLLKLLSTESLTFCFMLSGGHQEKRFCSGEVLLRS